LEELARAWRWRSTKKGNRNDITTVRTMKTHRRDSKPFRERF
jgi:hypothetical protein